MTEAILVAIKNFNARPIVTNNSQFTIIITKLALIVERFIFTTDIDRNRIRKIFKLQQNFTSFTISDLLVFIIILLLYCVIALFIIIYDIKPLLCSFVTSSKLFCYRVRNPVFESCEHRCC